MTKIRKVFVALASVGVAVALLWALGHLRSPAETLMWGQLMNFGHVPLFGVLATCLLVLFLSLLGDSLPRPRLYVVVLAWTLVLAGGSEALQVLDNRDVAAWDYLRNAIGATSALALWASVDRRLEAGAAWPNWRSHLRLFAAAAVLAALVPVGLTAESYRRMSRRAPVLIRFDSVLELLFVRTRNASLELIRAPAAWKDYAGRRVGRVEFEPARYPSLEMFELHPDWEAYDILAWDLVLAGDRGVDVILRVNDLWHDRRYRDRFNVKLQLQPGPNRLRIPLEEVRSAPEGRDMDMSAIQAVVLFVVSPETPRSVCVADLRLVKRLPAPREAGAGAESESENEGTAEPSALRREQR